MKKLIYIMLVGMTYYIGNAYSKDFFPANILFMNPSFANHVILVEKSTHKLYLYENKDSMPKLVKTFLTATGKFKGDKSVSGDHKTPEGIYTIYDFLSTQELIRKHGDYAKIYGPGAFPMDYPNLIDQRRGKGGGGIWLHSTDDDSRISKGLDSRGCVVVQGEDIKEIAQYIQLKHTPVIVVQDFFHLSHEAWQVNRKDIKEMVDNWVSSWQKKDLLNYITHYDKERFFHKKRGNYQSYKSYKSAVFSRSDTPEIKMEYISILAAKDYAVVQLRQDYRSSIINDNGKKTLYLQKDRNYNWKIVGEEWSRIEDNTLASTIPSKRFFKE